MLRDCQGPTDVLGWAKVSQQKVQQTRIEGAKCNVDKKSTERFGPAAGQEGIHYTTGRVLKGNKAHTLISGGQRVMGHKHQGSVVKDPTESL